MVAELEIQNLLSQMVGIPSESTHEERVSEFLGDYLTSKGLRIGHHRFNIHVTIGSGKPDASTLLFVSHIDTVAATSSWTIDPYAPTVKEGRMYGLGSNDAKASIAAMVHALIDVNNSDLPEELAKRNQTILFIAAAEEEIAGWNGFRGMVGSFPHIKAVIIGEPTSLRIGNSQRGREVIDLTTHGRSAHSSRPYEGVNAARKLVEELGNIFGWHKELFSDDPDAPTLEPTILKSGEKTNQLPDQAVATLDSRTTQKFSGALVLATMEEHKLHPDTTILCREQNSVAAKFTQEKSPLIVCVKRILEETGINPITYAYPSASDFAFVPSEVHGIILGPGDSDQSHQADESVDLQQVFIAQRVFSGIMRSSILAGENR